MTLEEAYYLSQIAALLPGTADACRPKPWRRLVLSALSFPKIKGGLEARAPRSCS